MAMVGSEFAFAFMAEQKLTEKKAGGLAAQINASSDFGTRHRSFATAGL